MVQKYFAVVFALLRAIGTFTSPHQAHGFAPKDVLFVSKFQSDHAGLILFWPFTIGVRWRCVSVSLSDFFWDDNRFSKFVSVDTLILNVGTTIANGIEGADTCQVIAMIAKRHTKNCRLS